MTPTGRRIMRQDYRGNEAYTVTRQDILAIESEAQRLTVERLRQRFDFDPCHECDNAEAAYVALAREETRE